jgi:signal transduction histidine kinase
MSGTDLAGTTTSARTEAVVQEAPSGSTRSRKQSIAVDTVEGEPRGHRCSGHRVGLPSSVLHELRTPLTSIHGYAQVLQRSVRDNPRAVNALAVVVRESTRLSAMLAALSEMAELDSGEPFSPAVDVEVQNVVGDVVHEVERRDAGAHPIRVEGYGVARCNPTLLGQALLHVLTNATLFSPDGTPVNVSIGAQADGIEILVEDGGPGIAEAEADRIYEPFERGSYARSASIRGLGLGLYLASEALARTHGRLDHESRQQGGTTFRLLVPRG